MKKMWIAFGSGCLIALPALTSAQTHDSKAKGAGRILPPAQQIPGAVAPAPEAMRPGAAVLGYSPAGKLIELRRGSNELICLADDPKGSGFHPACYHKGLEPFMARGRELTAQGITGAKRDSIRNADVVAGRVKMPTAAALYTLTGPDSSFDPKTGQVSDEARPLPSIYVPFATTASTGLPDKPSGHHPWIMSAGTPRAHIMFGAHEH